MLMLIPPVTASPGMSSPPPRTRPSLGLYLWRVIVSPWCTFLLLILLAPAAAFSLLLPQGESSALPVQGLWLATLQGRYGRWTDLLSRLGLFDISHALWFQVLLVLVAFQGLVAAAEGWGQVWNWLCLRGELSPRLPPPRARERGMTLLASRLAEAVAEVQLAFQRLGYRVCVSEGQGSALLEAIRHPWLTLGGPLAYGGVALVCVAGLLGGRLDWQEGPVLLSPGQGHELRHVAGALLRVNKVGLARGSSELYSWVSLLRDGQALCAGVISSASDLGCAGVRIRQGAPEPALHIAGYDHDGHPLALQPGGAEEAAVPGVVVPLPAYSSHRSVELGESGLRLRIEGPSDEVKSLFLVEVYSGGKSLPIVQREITDTTSLVLDDLTLTLSPARVPSFQVHHHPTRLLCWAGFSLALLGLLLSLAQLPLHLWAQVEEREGESCVRLWLGHPLPIWGSAIRELESQMGASST